MSRAFQQKSSGTQREEMGEVASVGSQPPKRQHRPAPGGWMALAEWDGFVPGPLQNSLTQSNPAG